MYITRHIEDKIVKSLEMFKVVLITGPRQSGQNNYIKTTI